MSAQQNLNQTPTLAGSYDTPDLAYGVAINGNYAYVADRDSGVQIIDISDYINSSTPEPTQAPTEPSTQPDVKIFLQTQDAKYKVSNNSEMVSGTSGEQHIEIEDSAYNIVVPQTIENLYFSSAIDNYNFKSTNGKLEIYSGDKLLSTITPQDDLDGTLISFGNSTVALEYGSGGSLSLGGITVPDNSFSSITPVTYETQVNAPTQTATSKIFLSNNVPLYTLKNSNANILGASGEQSITIDSGVIGASVTQTIEKVVLTGNSGEYTFKNNASKLEIYSGFSKVASINLQDDSDGTIIEFADGSYSAEYAAGGELTLGGVYVSKDASGYLVLG